MPVSDKCLALLRELEGFSAEPYKDAAGKLTIGYGHVITAKDSFDPPITKVLACSILRDDVCIAEMALDDTVTVPLTQNQYDALACFVFNVGRHAFAHSTLLRKLNEGSYQSVPGELMKWVNSGGQRIAGLVARRQKEVELWDSI